MANLNNNNNNNLNIFRKQKWNMSFYVKGALLDPWLCNNKQINK